MSGRSGYIKPASTSVSSDFSFTNKDLVCFCDPGTGAPSIASSFWVEPSLVADSVLQEVTRKIQGDAGHVEVS